ncbi:hypothetical protein H6P81_004939 [Aristolochia fimbriata]|uniref:Uncharacterized protein n=1 Tax=Aristolochia fimbriata TaxID=158543 RepID=A0AAV7EVC8_ARIFI|nr:hypothetical protein H6P81_004939 [Aristolochia fimbriata]
MKTCFFLVVNQSLGTESKVDEGSFTAAPGTTTLWRRKESSEWGPESGTVVPGGIRRKATGMLYQSIHVSSLSAARTSRRTNSKKVSKTSMLSPSTVFIKLRVLLLQ